MFAEDDLERTEFEPNLLEMLDFSIQESKRMIADGCKGFFIMAEGSKIDWASHDNDYEYYLKEMQEFETVEKALNYAQENNDTLVIVTADHETGGLLIEQADARYRETGKMKNFMEYSHWERHSYWNYDSSICSRTWSRKFLWCNG